MGRRKTAGAPPVASMSPVVYQRRPHIAAAQDKWHRERERKREKKQCHKKRRLVLKQTRGERMSLRADEMDDEGHLYHQIRRCGHLLFDPPPKLNPPPPQTKNQFQHTGRLYSPTRKDSLDVSASRNRGASPTCNFFPLCVCILFDAFNSKTHE